LRYGIKESTGGIGADTDLSWFNRELRFSIDALTPRSTTTRGSS